MKIKFKSLENKKGQAAAEFGLVLIILVPLFYWTFQYFYLLYVKFRSPFILA